MTGGRVDGDRGKHGEMSVASMGDRGLTGLPLRSVAAAVGDVAWTWGYSPAPLQGAQSVWFGQDTPGHEVHVVM